MTPNQFAIDTLLDEVLLEVFACYVEKSQRIYAWHALACVCRRWRRITFGSPRRLNLRILCSDRGPVLESLYFRPPIPIVLTSDCFSIFAKENILATLEHHDRVCQIQIRDMSWSLWEEILPMMQKPFPMLTELKLWKMHTDINESMVIRSSFLGGSAVRLRKLNLGCIPFPGLPKLLLSATHLVHLELYDIPVSGYIAPDAMVTCLSTLTRLQFLRLSFDFESPRQARPRPESERRRTSLPTRALLPSLTSSMFERVSEYLQDIIDRIDAPQFERLKIKFINHPSRLDTSRLTHFINRVPKLKTCNEARMHVANQFGFIEISKTTTNASLLLDYWYESRQPGSHLSPLVRPCTSSLPQALIHTVECLIIIGSEAALRRQDPNLWRELLQPFTAVKDLYLSQSPEIPSRLALVLQELVEESVLELLPVLKNIFLRGRRPWGLVPKKGIEQLIAALQPASHSISVSCWEKDRKVLKRVLKFIPPDFPSYLP